MIGTLFNLVFTVVLFVAGYVLGLSDTLGLQDRYTVLKEKVMGQVSLTTRQSLTSDEVHVRQADVRAHLELARLKVREKHFAEAKEHVRIAEEKIAELFAIAEGEEQKTDGASLSVNLASIGKRIHKQDRRAADEIENLIREWDKISVADLGLVKE